MLSEKEMIQKLVDHGKKMRTLQKQYFAEPDYKTRQRIIGHAKQAEREFDNVVFNIEQLLK